MSKKRTPKTAATLSIPAADADADADATTEQPANVGPTEAADGAARPPLYEVTNAVEQAASVDSKRGKKDEAAKADKQEKREKKAKRSKKNKKEKAAKAVKPDKVKPEKKAKRDKPRGKKDKSTVAPELRPLRKVNVVLIEPNGQPRAHFDGEIGVLDLLLPKKAEGDDSGA